LIIVSLLPPFFFFFSSLSPAPLLPFLLTSSLLSAFYLSFSFKLILYLFLSLLLYLFLSLLLCLSLPPSVWIFELNAWLRRGS
jgi:hypothetical protein